MIEIQVPSLSDQQVVLGTIALVYALSWAWMRLSGYGKSTLEWLCNGPDAMPLVAAVAAVTLTAPFILLVKGIQWAAIGKVMEPAPTKKAENFQDPSSFHNGWMTTISSTITNLAGKVDQLHGEIEFSDAELNKIKTTVVEAMRNNPHIEFDDEELGKIKTVVIEAMAEADQLQLGQLMADVAALRGEIKGIVAQDAVPSLVKEISESMKKMQEQLKVPSKINDLLALAETNAKHIKDLNQAIGRLTPPVDVATQGKAAEQPPPAAPSEWVRWVDVNPAPGKIQFQTLPVPEKWDPVFNVHTVEEDGRIISPSGITCSTVTIRELDHDSARIWRYVDGKPTPSTAGANWVKFSEGFPVRGRKFYWRNDDDHVWGGNFNTEVMERKDDGFYYCHESRTHNKFYHGEDSKLIAPWSWQYVDGWHLFSEVKPTYDHPFYYNQVAPEVHPNPKTLILHEDGTWSEDGVKRLPPSIDPVWWKYAA